MHRRVSLTHVTVYLLISARTFLGERNKNWRSEYSSSRLSKYTYKLYILFSTIYFDILSSGTPAFPQKVLHQHPPFEKIYNVIIV